MASAILQQPTFSSGEVSPSLYGRVDLSRYASALALCSNFFVRAEGGVTKRPGTKFVCPVKDANNLPALIPFQFSTDDAYMLEFGASYIRVIRDGVLVGDDAEFTATVANNSGSARFTLASGSLPAQGTQVKVTGYGTALSWKGRYLTVENVSGNDFDLEDWETTDTVAYASDMAGQTIALDTIYEVATGYAANEVANIKYAQSADVLYLAHPSHPPFKLSRTVGGANPTFTLTNIVFNERLEKPTVLTSAGSWVNRGTTTNAAFPNNRGTETYVITAADSTGVNAESLPSGELTAPRDANWADTTAESEIRLSNLNAGSFPTGADTFNVYKRVGGVFLFIGETNTTEFRDPNLTPAPGATSPPENRLPLGVTIEYSGAATGNPIIGDTVTGSPSGATGTLTFLSRDANSASGTMILSGVSGTFTTSDTITSSGSGALGNTTPAAVDSVTPEYPSTVTFFEDRLVWASSTLNPQTVWTSQSSDYENFSVSQTLVASDGVEFTVNSRQVNKIEHMVPLNDLLLLTSGAVWAASGAGENEPLAPNSIRVKVQSFNGSSNVSPVFIDDTILYIQDKSRTIRDLRYEFTTDSYAGNDLSVMSRHLFEDRTVVAWDLAKSPYELVWLVMSDGDMTCLTYMREHDVRGWSRHTIGGSGSVSDVGVIPEVISDTGRSVDTDSAYIVVTRGNRAHIERIQPREYSELNECWFLDNAVKVSAGEGSSSNKVHGLWHMEGQTVWALNDGNVEEALVVTDGAVTLNNASASEPVLVGFPYTASMETLDYNVDAEGGALHAQRRRTPKVFIRTRDTRGLEVAQDAGSALNPVKERIYTPNSPIALVSDVIEASIQSSWERQGKVYIQAKYPVPAEILSVMPMIAKGG